MWQADPFDEYDAVEIGDVGYIRFGKFKPLFNVRQRVESFEVDARRLDAPHPIGSEAIARVEWSAGVNAGPFGPLGSAEAGMSYNCVKAHGAILALFDKHAHGEDCDLRGKKLLGEYMVAQYKNWLNERSELECQDLVLITGYHQTRDWEAVLFSASDRGASASAGADLPLFITAHAKLRLQKTTGFSLDFSSGHYHKQEGSADPCCDPVKRNQSIFLRGWRIRERLMRRPKLKAAAGPHQLPDPDHDNADKVELEHFPGDDDKVRSPYDDIFDYLFEKSGANIALVHDDDVIACIKIRRLFNGPPESMLDQCFSWSIVKFASDADDVAVLYHGEVPYPVASLVTESSKTPISPPTSPDKHRALRLDEVQQGANASLNPASLVRKSLKSIRNALTSRRSQDNKKKLHSDHIDATIAEERRRKKQEPQPYTLLLLGQSESGKTTLQKQFQMLYASDTFNSRATFWKLIIFWNLTRAMLRVVQSEPTADPRLLSAFSIDALDARSSQSHASLSAIPGDLPEVDDASDLRVKKLISLEQKLAKAAQGSTNTNTDQMDHYVTPQRWRTMDISTSPAPAEVPSLHSNNGDDLSNERYTDIQDAECIKLMSAACLVLNDIVPYVEGLMATSINGNSPLAIKLTEWEEYFLGRMRVILSADYEAGPDDILHARLQTIRAYEQRFRERGSPQFHERGWRVVDVGGAKGQRDVWSRYFDNADAVVFLAPLSAIDQTLEEDGLTNRMSDSLDIFRQICMNPLLKAVDIVLFLNKSDVLERKLAAGLNMADYIRNSKVPNDFESIITFWKSKFMQIYKTTGKRGLFHAHVTNMIDTKNTQNLITSVQDTVLRNNLQNSNLI